MKTYKIDPQERQSILEMHINATKRQYLSEQTNEVQGTLKGADKSSMIAGYKDLLDKIADDKQMFVIANSNGNVSVGATSSQLNGKFFTPSDTIKFIGNGMLVVYPKGMMDQQFIVQPKNGRLMLFVGA
jgi:hypothetical protein